MKKKTAPPWSPLEIAEMAVSGDLERAYECLADVYRFFLGSGTEAPGEYKALHLALLMGEIRSEMPRSHGGVGD